MTYGSSALPKKIRNLTTFLQGEPKAAFVVYLYRGLELILHKILVLAAEECHSNPNFVTQIHLPTNFKRIKKEHQTYWSFFEKGAIVRPSQKTKEIL